MQQSSYMRLRRQLFLYAFCLALGLCLVAMNSCSGTGGDLSGDKAVEIDEGITPPGDGGSGGEDGPGPDEGDVAEEGGDEPGEGEGEGEDAGTEEKTGINAALIMVVVNKLLLI